MASSVSATGSRDWLLPACAGVAAGVGLGALLAHHLLPRAPAACPAPAAPPAALAAPSAEALAAVESRCRAQLPLGSLLRVESSSSSLPAPLVDTFLIPHLDELMPTPGREAFESPMLSRTWPVNKNFIAGRESILTVQGEGHVTRCLMAAGPHQRLYFNPACSSAAIVTCGGLCPGLNTVIRELVMCLTYVYKFPAGSVWGVPGGYRGFYESESAWLPLTPDAVARIHGQGGTILGSSRGGFNADLICDALQRRRVDVVFIIGGDGTHRGAAALYTATAARGMRISIACVPKTIDNDIGIMDVSFGVATAVQAAVHPITCAHTEALAAKNGVGLVKLMGRSSGFIAMSASMASRDVNVTLLPEADWSEAALCAFVQARLARRSHCVIVVAEGAQSMEQKASGSGGGSTGAKDESGNPILGDIGSHIKDVLNAHFKKVGVPLNLKYIDPSYTIRSEAANAADSELCTSLAFNCVHGAMAGYTGFTTGVVDRVPVWLPVSVIATAPPRRVDVNSRMYARMCTSTGQPDLAPHSRKEGAALHLRLKRAESFTYVHDEEEEGEEQPAGAGKQEPEAGKSSS